MSEQMKSIDAHYLLEKFPGKGGWTYASIPEIAQSKETPFGWVTVSGSIDSYELRKYKLMPMGNGTLFLPVKSEIRKKIRKEAGDMVHIILQPDTPEIDLPEEIKQCFETEDPEIYKAFISRPIGEQKAFVDWIYNAKKDETKVNRIVEMINKLRKGQKFYST